ncbi:hypothetical protein A8709_32755 [Paenibacillus pectinilyticus]|uniref:DNA-binding response regulator n=1 Tax=Paenibacillus pectinilyticus TaxID=512399 RepID=A0A1C0ZWW2_9BACL|nr:response regulator [Paenibacillus pectinilyticus]OCT12586.1 hypothetical protein A8709_32755 [Paenibacillus pectinilyticus]
MKTVVIVDDEALVRVGLQSIINWEDQGYRLIGAYKSGVEAWEAMNRHMPDILLTDIRMPEMDGLELIRHVRSVNKTMNILILSSYEEFSYLRKSIQLGVQDYIPKHELEPMELIRILNNLTYQDDESESPYVSKAYKEQNEKQELLESTRFIRGIQVRKESMFARNYPILNEKWGKQGTRAAWFVVKPIPRKGGYKPSEWRALTVLAEDIMERSKGFDYIGVDGDQLHGLVLLTPTQDQSEQAPFLFHLASKFREALAYNLNIDAVIGISTISSFATTLTDFRKSAIQALLHSFYRGAGIYITDIEPELQAFTEQEWVQIQKTVRQFLAVLDLEGVFHWLKSSHESFSAKVLPSDVVRLYRSTVNRILEQIQIKFEGAYHREDQVKVQAPEFELSEDPESIVELHDIAQKIVKHRYEAVRFLQMPWVRQALTYIDTHYSDPLKLEEVASQVNFSEGYFSQKFQAELGCHFTDYLARVRISKALELIRFTEIGTEEIAAAVGYPNPNYFIKVFKRIMGMTLSDYKLSLRGGPLFVVEEG